MITELRTLIRQEIARVIKEDVGAWRRVIITSPKKDAIEKEIIAFMKAPDFKSKYPSLKITFKPAVKDNTLIVDLNGPSATGISKKVSDYAKKHDKSAAVKIRTEPKLSK